MIGGRAAAPAPAAAAARTVAYQTPLLAADEKPELVVLLPRVHTVAYQDPAPAPPPHVLAVPPALPRESSTGPLPLHVVAALPAPATIAAGQREVTVNLQSVLDMTESQNASIALARKRVEEAAAAECEGRFGQLTRLLHCGSEGGEEGGGGRYAAAARTWQRRVELARTTNETLLDAGNTYFDLLTARRGEAIGHELQKYEESLLRRAEDLAKSDRSATVLVESLRAELAGRRAAIAKLRQQGDGAAAKLAYLLNLPPETPVVPQDASLEPVDLVDASPAAAALVARAQSEGPGVRELSGLAATIEEGIASIRPCLALLPRVARQLQTAQFKLEETRLALDDLRGKLAAGVIEAREAIQSGRVQVTDTAEDIRHAAETYRLSDLRLTEGAPGASTSDVSRSIRGLELSHFNHLTTVAAYDKAQLRLLLLLGRENGPSGGACPHP
jgi:hypothetical protein